MRHFGLITALFLYLPVSHAAELVRKDVLEGKVSLLLPSAFTVMSEDMRRLKYPSDSRPPIVYTNAEGSINVAINHTENKMPETSMPVAKVYLENVLKAQSPTATWLKSEAVSRQARTVILYDFRAPAIDTIVRNIMFGASLDGTLLIITFNCTMAEEAEWAVIGQRIIDSIEINDE